MPKLIFLCTRGAALTHDQYTDHLLTRHVPLALRHHATLQRYVLNIVDEAVEGSESIDSLNALSYASLADFETRNYDSPAGERIVTEDHARFLGGAAGYLTHECVYRDAQSLAAIGSRSPGVKWISALRRTARVGAEQFFSALETDLVPELIAAQAHGSRVVVDRVERKLYPGGSDWDAFLETSFAEPGRAPLHPFDSFDCASSLRGRIARLCDATAIWRVSEYVEHA